MQDQISERTIRGNAFKEGGVFVPNSILTNPHLSSLEKLLYAHILALNVNGRGCYQSTHYIAAKLGSSAPTVKRSIYALVKLGLVKRIQRGEGGKMRELHCCQFVGSSISDGYRLDQNDPSEVQYDPNDDNGYLGKGIKMIPDQDQSDPDKIPSYNTNIIYKTDQDQSDPTPHSEKNTPEAKTPAATPKKNQEPSPKVPAKGSPAKSPRPDAEDKSLRVMMTDAEWDKFQRQVGDQCAFWWCQQFEDYAESQPKKFKSYTSHYRTLLKWHQMRCADGLVFGWTPQGGNGFYKHWVTGLKVGGRDEK